MNKEEWDSLTEEQKDKVIKMLNYNDVERATRDLPPLPEWYKKNGPTYCLECTVQLCEHRIMNHNAICIHDEKYYGTRILKK